MFLLMSVVLTIKKRPAKRARENNTEDATDLDQPESMSVRDWRRLPREALRLRCISLNLLDSGTREVLANRLFDFYHEPQETFPPIPTPSTPDLRDTISPAIAAERVAAPEQQPDVVMPSNVVDITNVVSAIQAQVAQALEDVRTDIRSEMNQLRGAYEA